MEARGLKREDIAIKNEDGSAYGEANRPVFDGIMRALEGDDAQNPDMANHKHKGIIFFDLSRLSRNQRDFLRIEKSMER